MSRETGRQPCLGSPRWAGLIRPSGTETRQFSYRSVSVSRLVGLVQDRHVRGDLASTLRVGAQGRQCNYLILLILLGNRGPLQVVPTRGSSRPRASIRYGHRLGGNSNCPGGPGKPALFDGERALAWFRHEKLRNGQAAPTLTNLKAILARMAAPAGPGPQPLTRCRRTAEGALRPRREPSGLEVGRAEPVHHEEARSC
jgi:hypothetical protein